MTAHVMTPAERMCLHSAARDLHTEFRGILSARKPSKPSCSTATPNSPQPPCPQLAGHRRRAVYPPAPPGAHPRSSDRQRQSPGRSVPVRAQRGRSQMALAWFTHLANDRAIAWSGGSEPVAELNPAVIAAMSEVGVDITREFSKPWTDEFVLAADVVITMGCGDACPLLPGKHYEDWELDDPAGKNLEGIRAIRDEIRDRVTNLIEKLTGG